MTALAEIPTMPWRVIEWTNENGRTVRELAFHKEETQEVLDLPFPDDAVVREPIMLLTDFFREYKWFRRHRTSWSELKYGDVFYENINQGDRACKVLAVDENGRVLYDYEMPRGRTFHRIDGRPVNIKRLPKKWRRLMNGE